MRLLLIAALLFSQQAYLLDHPIDPASMLLATQTGEYRIARQPACDWMREGATVTLVRGEAGADGSVTVVLEPVGGGLDCATALYGLVDSSPCFVDSLGECDPDGVAQ